MVTAVAAVTCLVAIGKVTVVALAGTVTETGTVAAMGCCSPASPLHRRPAPLRRVSPVPVLPAGPVTAAGLTLTPTSPAAGGFTVSVAVLFTPL
jgi:hypothetical protein